MQNREKIIEAAIRCFRRKGVQTISTNHIAESAKISQGNLYYHFRNKEAIIREIFERIVGQMSQTWKEFDMEHAEVMITRMFRRLRALYRGYGFFYRDLPELLRRDPILRERYREVRRQRLSEMDKMFINGREQGWCQGSEEELKRLSRSLWFVSEYWPSHMVVSEDSVESQLDGQLLTIQLIRPYLTSQAQVLLAQVVVKLQSGERKEKK